MSNHPFTTAPTHTNQRQMRTTRRMLDQSLERLASGYQVQRALKNNESKSSIQALCKKILSLQHSQKNAQDGVELLHTVELGLNEIHRLLQQMQELGQQATSENVGVKERVYLDIEYQTLKEEILNTAHATKFQDVPLLNATNASLEIQVNSTEFNFTGGETLTYEVHAHAVTPEHLGIAHLRIDTKETSRSSLAKMEDAVMFMNNLRSSLALLQQKLHAAIRNMNIFVENLTAANSQWHDNQMLGEGLMAHLQAQTGTQNPNLATTLATPLLSEP